MPAASAAWMMVEPLATSTVLPSIVTLAMVRRPFWKWLPASRPCHGRAWPGHPRLAKRQRLKVVGGRAKPGHDGWCASPLLRRHRDRGLRLIRSDTLLHQRAEMTDQSLDRPGGRI